MAGVPYTFATATTSIPLSQLDANFNTTLTLGNTSVGLGNTVTTIGNLTLTNVTIASGTTNVSANSIVNGTSNVVIASSGGAVNIATNGTTGITIDTSQVLKVTNNANYGLQMTAQTGGVTGSLYADGSGFGITASNSNINNSIYATSTNLNVFRTNGSERMRIDSSGNVGIGTNSPNYPLNVVSNTNADSGIRIQNTNSGGAAYTEIWLGSDTNASAAAIFVPSSGNGNWGGSQSLNLYTAGSYPITFNTNNTEKMRIDSSGNVCIGTTSASEKLRINAGASTRAIKIVGDAAWIEFDNTNTKITGGGNLQGYAASQVQFIAGGSAGVYLASGAGSWTAISDERQKDIIEPITNGAEKVASLRAVIGKYKTDKEGTRRAFLIAQDVQKVLPEAISTYNKDGEDTEYLGVAYTDTIPLLVSAIQEQQAIIEQLKTKVGL